MPETESEFVGLPAPTAEEAQESRRILTWSEDALKTVRKTAESWRNAGFVSAGIALAGALIGGPHIVTDLPAPFRGIVIVLLAITFMIALTSASLSVLASIGWPTWIDTSNSMALKTWESKRVKTASAQIRTSMILAVCAALLVGSAITVILLATPRSNTRVFIPHDLTHGYCVDFTDDEMVSSEGRLTNRLNISVPEGAFSRSDSSLGCS